MADALVLVSTFPLRDDRRRAHREKQSHRHRKCGSGEPDGEAPPRGSPWCERNDTRALRGRLFTGCLDQHLRPLAHRLFEDILRPLGMTVFGL